MNPDPVTGRVAQPADEELKTHGDKLGQQVRDVAAQPSPSPPPPQNAPENPRQPDN